MSEIFSVGNLFMSERGQIRIQFYIWKFCPNGPMKGKNLHKWVAQKPKLRLKLGWWKAHLQLSWAAQMPRFRSVRERFKRSFLTVTAAHLWWCCRRFVVFCFNPFHTNGFAPCVSISRFATCPIQKPLLANTTAFSMTNNTFLRPKPALRRRIYGRSRLTKSRQLR